MNGRWVTLLTKGLSMPPCILSVGRHDHAALRMLIAVRKRKRICSRRWLMQDGPRGIFLFIDRNQFKRYYTEFVVQGPP